MTATDADLAAENARLRVELGETRRKRDAAIEQQAAADSVLTAISEHPGYLQPVLDKIVESATRLAASEQVQMFLQRDGRWLLVAEWVGDRLLEGRSLSDPTDVTALTPTSTWWQALAERRTIALHGGVDAIARTHPDIAAVWRLIGERTGFVFGSGVTVPLLSGEDGLGALIVRRVSPEPYTDDQVRLLETFAKQAVIAIENTRLFEETRAKSRELEASNLSLKEALERQTATAEILQVISNSPTDVQPVFDTIVRSGARLTGANACNITLVDGDRLEYAAVLAPLWLQQPGTVANAPPDWAEVLRGSRGETPSAETVAQMAAIPITAGSPLGQAVLEGRTIHIEDAAAVDPNEFPLVAEFVTWFGNHAVAATPLLRNGVPIGVLTVGRRAEEFRPFDANELGLLETFSAQAVIAIENAHLFQELQEQRRQLENRNRELAEALEQQTATSEILGIISSSPTDLQPVFAAVAERAQRLLDGDSAVLGLREGDRFRVVAEVGPTFGALTNQPVPRSLPLGNFPLARAVREARTIHLHGTPDEVSPDDPRFAGDLRALGWERLATVVVPLLHDGTALGGIAVGHADGVPFTERQIALLETFAAQVVIAMQNTRLFTELAERNHELAAALDRQTTLAEILRTISTSPTDASGVMRAIAEAAARLCDADDVTISGGEGDQRRVWAHLGRTWQVGDPLGAPEPGLAVGRALIERRIVHIPDLALEPDGEWSFKEVGLAAGSRTFLAAPLVVNDQQIGAILLIRRGAARPFSEDQIGLFRTFADQASIAIANARLFDELQESNAGLREALEQQTATAEVLRIISSSPTDVQPVLEAIAHSAARLCATDSVNILRPVDGGLRMVTRTDGRPLLNEVMPASTDWVGGRAFLDRQTVHVVDWPSFGGAIRITLLAIPLLREDTALGVIVLTRRDLRPFSETEIALMQTFADQAVIAIENTLLFDEIQEKNRELEALNHQLEEASRHKSAFLSSMSHELRTPLNAIIGYSEMLAEDAADAGHDDMLPDLRRVNGAGKHLLSLISNVLDLSKIEAGKMDLAIEDFAVEELLGEVEAVVPPLMSKNNNQFVLQVDGELGSMNTDKTKLRQALLNLLSNAAKFTDHGTITVTVERVQQQGEDWMTFAVTDTGIGMTEEQQAKLFGAFSQAEADTSARYGGTGLGLALSREFCRMLGGDITVVSAPEKGSTFSIRLPARVAGAAAGREAPGTMQAGTG